MKTTSYTLLILSALLTFTLNALLNIATTYLATPILPTPTPINTPFPRCINPSPMLYSSQKPADQGLHPLFVPTAEAPASCHQSHPSTTKP